MSLRELRALLESAPPDLTVPTNLSAPGVSNDFAPGEKLRPTLRPPQPLLASTELEAAESHKGAISDNVVKWRNVHASFDDVEAMSGAFTSLLSEDNNLDLS